MGSKLKNKKELARILAGRRREGKRVVFTNGCFDILHLGHIRYLRKAKALGDILVVGLNSDASVRALKGTGRPVNNQSSRAEILASLYFVDYVAIFGEPTPERLIRLLRPDVLVKGSDWKANEIAGSSFVKSLGGEIVTVPFVKGYSTTSLIKKMRR